MLSQISSEKLGKQLGQKNLSSKYLSIETAEIENVDRNIREMQGSCNKGAVSLTAQYKKNVVASNAANSSRGTLLNVNSAMD